MPVSQIVQKENSLAIEETSTCTSLDDSLSSGTSSQSGQLATKLVTEPSMLPLPEGPLPDDYSAASAALRDKTFAGRRVSFNYVHVKEFDRIVGDNPSCSFGVPIGIGWTLENEAEIDMEEYETFRNSNRRSKVQLILPKETREVLLMDWGVTTEEISQAVKEKVKIKNQRNFTVAKLGTLDALEELMEKRVAK